MSISFPGELFVLHVCNAVATLEDNESVLVRASAQGILWSPFPLCSVQDSCNVIKLQFKLVYNSSFHKWVI